MTDTMTYKGFSITPKYCEEDRKFSASVLFTNGSGYVSGETVEELERQFHETVDGMLEHFPEAKPRPPSLIQRAARMLKSA